MSDNEYGLITHGQTTSRGLDGELMPIPPEYQGYWDFYALLRRGTIQTIDRAKALLRDDPEIADPTSYPNGHFQDAKTKYGVYGPIPSMPVTMGAYHLARLDYIVNSEPDTYSPDFKPFTLQQFIGLNDPIIAVLHCAYLLVDQADIHEPLQLIFNKFPSQDLYGIDISGETVGDQFCWDALREAQRQIAQFKRIPLRKVLSWQKSLGSPVVDGTVQTNLLRAGD